MDCLGFATFSLMCGRAAVFAPLVLVTWSFRHTDPNLPSTICLGSRGLTSAPLRDRTSLADSLLLDSRGSVIPSHVPAFSCSGASCAASGLFLVPRSPLVSPRVPALSIRVPVARCVSTLCIVWTLSDLGSAGPSVVIPSGFRQGIAGTLLPLPLSCPGLVGVAVLGGFMPHLAVSKADCLGLLGVPSDASFQGSSAAGSRWLGRGSGSCPNALYPLTSRVFSQDWGLIPLGGAPCLPTAVNRSNSLLR